MPQLLGESLPNLCIGKGSLIMLEDETAIIQASPAFRAVPCNTILALLGDNSIRGRKVRKESKCDAKTNLSMFGMTVRRKARWQIMTDDQTQSQIYIR